MFDTKVHKLKMDAPSDTADLEKKIDAGEIAPEDIKGIMVMVEGDGFARELTTTAFLRLLSRKTDKSFEELYRTVTNGPLHIDTTPSNSKMGTFCYVPLGFRPVDRFLPRQKNDAFHLVFRL